MWCLSLSTVDVLFFVFVFDFCCWIKIEIFSIAIDNLKGHGLPLQFGPINFPFRLLTVILSCYL